MAASHYLACDLGAESGRLMAGALADDRLTMTELHRFPTGPMMQGNSLCWDVETFFQDVKAGMRKAGSLGQPFHGISTDSWGLDYVLYDHDGAMMPPVLHYRDPRTTAGMGRVDRRVPWETVFAETGIQRLPINTIYQLAAEKPGRLEKARRLLLIADAFNHWLSGVSRTEVSLASTTQLYNPLTQSWSTRLLDCLEIPERLFADIVPSGTPLGPLRTDLQAATKLHRLEVMASCSHDTGAAVAAIPARGKNWAYISSGTWSLLGTELTTPIMSETCRRLNFTNEIGYGNTVRLLKNIVGLWLVQECRRHWSEQGTDYDYAALTRLAGDSPSFVSLIDPADSRFVSPGDMPRRIEEFCRETGQPVPATPGAFVRCALESLALLYRRTLIELETVCGRSMEVLHVVGGGSQNRLLNQFTANAAQIPVLAGPVEATAAGNILVQALGFEHISSLAQARDIVERSFPLESFSPNDEEVWHRAGEWFNQLTDSRRPRE